MWATLPISPLLSWSQVEPSKFLFGVHVHDFLALCGSSSARESRRNDCRRKEKKLATIGFPSTKPGWIHGESVA